MKMYTTNDDTKFLAVWLTGTERADAAVMSAIEPVMSAYDVMGYKTVVYSSGTGNLADNTAALLTAATQNDRKSDS